MAIIQKIVSNTKLLQIFFYALLIWSYTGCLFSSGSYTELEYFQMGHFGQIGTNLVSLCRLDFSALNKCDPLRDTNEEDMSIVLICYTGYI